MTRRKRSAMVSIDNLRKCSDGNGAKRQKGNNSTVPQPGKEKFSRGWQRSWKSVDLATCQKFELNAKVSSAHLLRKLGAHKTAAAAVSSTMSPTSSMSNPSLRNGVRYSVCLFFSFRSSTASLISSSNAGDMQSGSIGCVQSLQGKINLKKTR